MLSFSFFLNYFFCYLFSTPQGISKTKKLLHTLQARTVWCGGWDSNPRRPSPQGPKPRAGYDHAFCPLDLALVPPQISEARTTPRPWTNKDYLAAHIATISFPGPSDDKGGSPRVELEQRGAEDNECQELFFLNPDRRRTSPDQ